MQMTRQELTRHPLQKFRFDADGYIVCAGRPDLVLTASSVSLGAVYLHERSQDGTLEELQQWETVESRQCMPPAVGVLQHDLCHLRLRARHLQLYLDFNEEPHSGDPLMYAYRDKANQVLHLEPQSLRILHLSDTHSLHRHASFPGPLPFVDLLVHTGDFTISGTDAEYSDFDAWLGWHRNQSYFKHCVVIAGNHEFHEPSNRVCAGQLAAAQVLNPNYVRSRLHNATYLAHQEVNFEGMRIFGSTWEPYSDGCNPDVPGSSETEQALWAPLSGSSAAPHKFSMIPEGTHMLLTHGPARDILDWERPYQPYGSSAALRQRIVDCRVRAHLFGHIHEQRGVFVKNGFGGYEGGVEYVHPQEHELCAHPGPPPPHYPCDIVSNNAMKNNKRHEASADRHYIAGPPRMIIAHRQQGPGAVSNWRFELPN